MKVAFGQGRVGIISAVVALLALAIAFAGLSRAALNMALGCAPEGQVPVGEARPAIWPALVLLSIALVLGIWIPSGVMNALEQAARLLGGGVP